VCGGFAGDRNKFFYEVKKLCFILKMIVSEEVGVAGKGKWSSPPTMRASGSCYKKSMCMGKRTGTHD
jgi:hypothetical protein